MADSAHLGTYQGDYNLDVVHGPSDLHFGVNKFGRATVPTTLKDVWSDSGDYPYQTSAQSLEILSADVNDTSAGTGARTVRVFGLDAGYDLIQEDVTLNGTTPVALTNTYLRVYRAFVLTAGTGETNAGAITVRVPGPGDTQALIDADAGQTFMALYTVPAGFTGYMRSLFASVPQSKNAEVAAYARNENGAWRANFEIGVYQADIQHHFDPPMAIEEKTDIRIRASTSTATTLVRAGFDLVMKKNL